MSVLITPSYYISSKKVTVETIVINQKKGRTKTKKTQKNVPTSSK